MMRYLVAPGILLLCFAAAVIAAPAAAADFAMIYGVIFVLSLAPASIHVERDR